MNYSDATVIIPTLNEAENMGVLLNELNGNFPGIRIIVVDDGSKDNTIQIAQNSGAHVIDRSKSNVKGLTASVLEGMQTVTTEKVVVMDADFQHPPNMVGEIYKKLDSADLVIGIREDLKNLNILRRGLSSLGNLVSTIRIRRRVIDPLSGFFGLKRKIITHLKPHSFEPRGYKILMSILKIYKGEINYVKYSFNKRLAGESNLSMRHCYYFLRNILK